MPHAKPSLVGEDLSVAHETWGRIHVRNKRPAGVDRFGSDRIVIFQHGATYGSIAFDMAFAGMSWMDYAAARGFDTYCIDLPGYGRSDRPAQMSEPAENNPPFMRTPDAADCLGKVVDFVCKRRGVVPVGSGTRRASIRAKRRPSSRSGSWYQSCDQIRASRQPSAPRTPSRMRSRSRALAASR